MNEKCLKNCLYVVLNGKNISKFDKEFIKHYDENSDKRYIFETDV